MAKPDSISLAPWRLAVLVLRAHQVLALPVVSVLHHPPVPLAHFYLFYGHILRQPPTTFNIFTVSFSSTVSDICFQIGEFSLLCFIIFSISIRKCCCGPKIDPGRAILIHPMKSAALK